MVNPIRDEAFNNAPAFSGVAVANNSDPRPEPVVDGTPSVTGSQLVITYELELDPDSTPAATDYTVTVAGSRVTVDRVVVGGMTVTLTLETATVAGDAVTVSYAPGTNPVRDLAMNAAAAFTVLEVENLTADNTPPSFDSLVKSLCRPN